MPKYNDIKKVICSYPWSEISTWPTGDMVICREQKASGDYGFLGNDPRNNIGQEADLNHIMNSDLHKQVRLAMLRGEWHENCSQCRDTIENPIKDNQRRIPDNKEILGYLKNTDNDGTIRDIKILTLDIRFSNLCNHACLHCNPTDSSMWVNEHREIFGNTILMSPSEDLSPRWDVTPRLKFNFTRTKRFWEIMDQVKDSVISLNILGGEPMIMPDHDTLLNYFIDNDCAKNIVLSYASNLSAINPKILEIWKSFKGVYISASMDDVYDRFDIIRYGGKWDTFIKNLDKLLAVPNINVFGASVCYMIPNMLSLHRIEEWSQSYYPDLPMIYRWVYTEKYISVDSLPKSAKQELIEFNQGLKTTRAQNLNRWIKTRLDQEEDPAAVDTFVRMMNHLDKSRKQDWRSTMPDVYDLLKRHTRAKEL